MAKNFTRLFKILVTVFLLSTSTCLWAQEGTYFEMGERHTIDLREFTANLKWESADVRSRIDTRAGTPAPDDIRWIDRIHNLPDYMRTFYDNHGQRVQEVLNGGTNYLIDPANDNKYAKHFSNGSTYLVLKEIKKGITYTYPKDVIDDNPSALQSYAVNAMNQDIDAHLDEYQEDVYAFIPYMFMSMSYDFPQAFWLGNYWSWATTRGCSYGGYMNNGIDSINYTFSVLFCINDNSFDYRLEDFRTVSVIRNGVNEFNNLVQNILADVPNSTRYAQVRYLNDWLTKHNAYSSAYASGEFSPIVWSPISALRGTNGEKGPVCEGYSRALKILLDKLNIPCILAVGDAKGSKDGTPESHMWNEVKMNDGQWYAVDVTWNDPLTDDPVQQKVSGAENENWLLLGRYDIVNQADDLTFAVSHPNSLVYGQTESAQWDYDNQSLITDYGFNPVTGVARIGASQKEDEIYSILGVRMNKSVGELEPGLYIINSRKVVIR